MEDKTLQRKIMILIPCYKEESAIRNVASQAIQTGLGDVVIVDDGSPDKTADEARAAGAHVIVHEVNKGKGAAMITGFTYALENNYEAVITLDGDGQHPPTEIINFVNAWNETNADMIVGTRMGNTENMPFIRLATNKFMSWLLSKSLGQRVSDTQNGFRLYTAKVLPICIDCSSGGFSAESEHLLQISLHGFKIAEAPTSTIYGEEKSKIRPVRDTIRFFKMLSHFRSEKRKFKKGQS
jgi:glycosyltransferase involved in cell wall biosynthesis